MKAWFRAYDSFLDRLGPVLRYLVIVAMFIITWETISRYLFNAPTIWAHGTSELIMACYYLLGGAYILRHGGHIKMDVIYRRLPLRTRAIVDLFNAMFFFLFCVVLVWKGAELAWGSLMILETTESPFLAPLYPVKMILPISAFLMLLWGLGKFIRDLVTATTGRPYEY